MKDIIFVLFALLTVISAGGVVFLRKPVHAAFSLLLTFFGVAGLYVFIGADFLAAGQIMVYVGGILVLILFGVMLTERVGNVPRIDVYNRHVMLTGGGVLVLFVILISLLLKTPWQNLSGTGNTNTVQRIGNLLLGRYVLPFEVASLLLLVSAIGAVVIIRKEFK